MSKVVKCPFCKSKEGFEHFVWLGGYQTTTYDFKGNIIHIDREGADNEESYVSCVSCKKTILLERVKIKN